MKTKTLTELRKEFEEMAINKMYDITPIHCKQGEPYRNPHTFQLWCGYFTCAVNNGIITGEDANPKNATKGGGGYTS